ncbi:glutathione S-transferase N-terminal domain-containing protein [Nodosilinea sp. AN01ver1]|uniref:glutathione S-transferase N-terminal domain-containing protein n=1 Tax=Nodosilinea sp. AN01ver1 TaxID=3423362 RepID=UPI003D31176F
MIDLYTFTTPNGRKPAILLEELEMPYTIHSVDITKNEQFAPEFLAISPNNKIPAIVDRDNDLAVFESGAILIYLAEKGGQLLPIETAARIKAIEWLMFQMASVGPMFGQLGHFRNFAPDQLPYAINRYEKEVQRLLGVMESQLAKTPYLAGDYSIADIATYPWVSAATTPYMGLTFDEFPNVQRWVNAIAARPAVQVGMDVLQPTFKSQFGTVAEAKA